MITNLAALLSLILRPIFPFSSEKIWNDFSRFFQGPEMEQLGTTPGGQLEHAFSDYIRRVNLEEYSAKVDTVR